MASVFTSIIRGDLPARFVWEDDVCVAFLSIDPFALGHTLVVPREEVVDWMTATPGTVAHVATTAQTIGRAQQAVWNTPRVGLLSEGFEVPHLHFHVFPATSSATFNFAHRPPTPDAAAMDEAARLIRGQLRAAGYAAAVPAEPTPA